jgi:hypothetical protein
MRPPLRAPYHEAASAEVLATSRRVSADVRPNAGTGIRL